MIAAGALRLADALRVPTPWLMADEFLYAELGRSLYEHGSLDVLGRDVPFYSVLHPLVVGAPLSLAGPELGYALAKSVQVLVMVSAAVPVFAWARRLASTGWALLAAALTLAVPGLAYAGLLVTEASFYPAFVLASWAAARAIARPTPAAQAVAVAAIVLAAAIRLQALVLLPAFATAVLIAAAMEGRARLVRRLAPALAALLAALGAWLVFQVARGGSGLGGYAAAADSGYAAGAAARFVAYHLADVLLFTAVVPACAFASLAWAALARRERDPELRAYVAVTLALTGWMVLEVGVFASRHVEHLAERNLFHVAPLLCIGLVVWLERGAPRTPVATAAIAVGALVLLVALPVERFTWLPALHNEPSLVPLYDLLVRSPDADLDVLVPSVALALVGLFALASRRLLVVLGVLLVPLGALATRSAGDFVVDTSRGVDRVTFDGPARRWVDEIAAGPVAYLYGDARFYPGALQTAFWNRRVTGLFELPGQRLPALPRSVVQGVDVEPDSGRIRGLGDVRYTLAPNTMTLIGTELERRGGLTLTRLSGPPRVARLLDGFHADGTIAGRAALRVYACRGGTLQLDLRADAKPARVAITRNGAPYLRFRLGRGRRHLEIPLTTPRGARPGTEACTVGFRVVEAVGTDRLRFRAPARR